MASAKTLEAVKRLVVKSALRIVDIDILGVDPAYQRDVKPKHKKIVADFQEEALGIPMVGEREDSTLWIVDGLQRITALKKLGRKNLRAEVFNSRGVEHEAEVYKRINMDRTKLAPGEIFKALLAGHDKLAWEIKEAVESCGHLLQLSGGGNNKKKSNAREVNCINTLVREARENGVEAIKFALTAAKECWPDDRVGVHNSTVGGMCTFYNRNQGVVDLERLYPRLKQTQPHKIIYSANMASLGNNLWHAVADVIEKVYRKRQGKRGG